jgi:hypothetical protein
MRKNLMRVGQQYIMQRGPTRRPLEVTMLAKDVPSGMGNRVMVRIEEGKEVEAPSSSISPLPGSEPVKPPPKRRPEPEPVQEAPPGWKPKKDEQVTWEQTLSIPLTGGPRGSGPSPERPARAFPDHHERPCHLHLRPCRRRPGCPPAAELPAWLLRLRRLSASSWRSRSPIFQLPPPSGPQPRRR